MDLRKVKVGTLLSVGIVAIIGLMISATIYSNYLTNNAQNIIEKSTSRIFDVLTIQRDTEELFSALSELVVIEEQEELNIARENIKRLFDRAKNTVRVGREKEIFSESDSAKANEIFDDVLIISSRIISLKEKTISQGEEQYENDQASYNGGTKLDVQFDNLRDIRFEMLGVVNEIIIRSDEEFRDAMDLVQIAQAVTWIVVGVSLALAVLLAYFLVRSAKKIFDLKNEFINIIAHDLRNPVTAIIGYLELITTTKDKSATDLNENLQAIEVSAQKLRNQINNLLEVGRTEAGHIKLNLEPVRVYDVINESITRAKALAETSGMKVIDEKTVGENVYVLADRSKLSDVLDNLISNAIKYNKKNGTVTISTQDTGEMFSISVADTGLGIQEDQKHKIFKKYSRLDSDGGKFVGGTGLGLYTVKLSMNKMNGTVTFESKDGVGTKFTISFKKVSNNSNTKQPQDTQ